MKPSRNICLVLGSGPLDDVRETLARPPAGIDALELRIDLLADAPSPATVAALVGVAAVPVVATCRLSEDGGSFSGTDAERAALLESAAGAGAALVDIEWDWWTRDPSIQRRFPRQSVLLSHHDWKGAPRELESRFEEMISAHVCATKLVALAESFHDVQRLSAMTSLAASSGRRAACFAVGPHARSSRLLSAVEGSFLIYVRPLGEVGAPADLLTDAEAVCTYRLGDIGDSVKLLGILGNPLDHSLSPVMHNAVIQTLGERYLYVPLASPDAGAVIEFARDHDFRGLSVTIPHKESVIPLMDGLDETAVLAGAVNTVVRDGGRLIGHNTDLTAARSILGDWKVQTDGPVVVLGAGGASRAVLQALQETGLPVTLLNRDAGRGRRLAEEFGATYGGGLDGLAKSKPAVLINATPLGTRGETIRLPKPAPKFVLDLAYRPGGTALEQRARQESATVVSGLDFLARQGAHQFALWTRRIVNVDLFRNSLPPATESVRAS